MLMGQYSKPDRGSRRISGERQEQDAYGGARHPNDVPAAEGDRFLNGAAPERIPAPSAEEKALGIVLSRGGS